MQGSQESGFISGGLDGSGWQARNQTGAGGRLGPRGGDSRSRSQLGSFQGVACPGQGADPLPRKVSLGFVRSTALPVSPASQYTKKLQRDLQDFRVNMESPDLLSPEAHRDLEKLQKSGLEKVSYHHFLIQVSRGTPATCLGRRGTAQRSWA